MAKLLFSKLSEAAGGVDPLVYNGFLCTYRQSKGYFEPITETAVQHMIMEYDGKRLPSEKRNIWLSNSDCKGIFDRLLVLASRSSLDPSRGVPFSNYFVTLDRDHNVITRPHSPDFGATFGLSIPWVDSVQRGWWYEAIFERVWKGDPEAKVKSDVLAEFVGACLFGAAAGYKKAVFLYGNRGNNGKSTLITAIRQLFDNPPIIEPHMLSNERIRARLGIARINTVPELGQDEFPAPEAIKAAIAGDAMRGRYLYRNDFEFTPVAGHLIAGNNLPTCKDMSNAFWSRWILLECPRTIPENERLDPIALKSAIHGALDEIAHWAIEGAARLLARNKYTPVPSSDRALLGWRKKSDQLAQFLEECTTEGPGVQLDALYDRYTAWAWRVGHRRMSKATFEERVNNRGLDLDSIVLRGGEVDLSNLEAARNASP